MELYTKNKNNIRTVWANGENPSGEKGGAAKALNGRKGSPCLFHFKPGETRVLASAKGSGIIRHIWIASEKRETPHVLKGYRLDLYWDNEEKSAVSVPLIDFFCYNTGVMVPCENEFFSNPEGRNFNCYIPMPFKTGMKITITNETDDAEENMFFYQIDYTLGDDTSDAMYFHAFYNRETSTKMLHDYTVLPSLEGNGRYLGASFGVIANPLMGKSWWGEGELKCYIDGDDQYPTLAGTGTEDYIGAAWGMGYFSHRYQGCLLSDNENMRFAFYRFHIPDPVYFSENIRVTIQQIGTSAQPWLNEMLDNGLDVYWVHGHKLEKDTEAACFERFGDDWCSIAYFYLDRPSSSLPALPPCKERMYKYDR